MPTPKFKPGQEKTSGRQKGTPNKFTDLKKAFIDVFEQIEKKEDGVKSFYEWVIKSDKNRSLFYQLISKMLPTNPVIEGELSVIINRIITRVKPEE